ncbi:MAG TPA: hypothetical protein DFS52_13450 [Myxococcales bacterium]|nr:hypothetical protein [Myxococcales bacterium]
MRPAARPVLGLAVALARPARRHLSVGSVDALAGGTPLLAEATVTRTESEAAASSCSPWRPRNPQGKRRAKHLILAATDDSLAGSRALTFATPPRAVSTTDCAGVPHQMPYVGRVLTGEPSRWTLPRRDFGLHVGREAIFAAIRGRRLSGPQRTVSVPVRRTPRSTSNSREAASAECSCESPPLASSSAGCSTS